MDAICPGCGLDLPSDRVVGYTGYFNVSPECWSVFGEVTGRQVGDAVALGGVHQLTVDSYAVQHAGGRHPSKSVLIHLTGMYLHLESEIPAADIAPRQQRLATEVHTWPSVAVPDVDWSHTVLDVALADDRSAHRGMVETWAEEIWAVWSDAHATVASILSAHPHH